MEEVFELAARPDERPLLLDPPPEDFPPPAGVDGALGLEPPVLVSAILVVLVGYVQRSEVSRTSVGS